VRRLMLDFMQQHLLSNKDLSDLGDLPGQPHICSNWGLHLDVTWGSSFRGARHSQVGHLN
jgi:hypothetical protein